MSKRTLTTNKLIDLIKLKGSIPQSTTSFKEKDFLYFINEEMDLGVLPHVLSFHEDYFLYTETVNISPNVVRYEIPSRAIGNKLRDITYVLGRELYEMTRISVEDQADRFAEDYYRREFYIEGNEIVIPLALARESGKLNISYYIRPNAIVSEDDVAVVTSINRNNGIVEIDKVPTVFSNKTQFDIVSSIPSFRLISKEITPDGIADDQTLKFTFGTQKKVQVTLPVYASIPASSYINVVDNSEGDNDVYAFWVDKTGSDVAPTVSGATLVRLDCSLVTNTSGLITVLANVLNSQFTDNRLVCVPSTSSFILQNGGNSISVGDNFTVLTVGFTSTQTTLSAGTMTIPEKLNVDDVISLPEETSIPQIPVELHPMLAQRCVMRCLESLGDVQGLQAAAAKLTEMEQKTGMIIDNRVESAPLKIVPRHTPIKRNSYKKNNRGY